MIWDGDCDFCRRWLERWRQMASSAVQAIPFQELGYRWPELSREECARAVQLVDTDGTVYSGAAAIFRSLASNRRHRWLLRAYKTIPGVPLLTERVYGFIARHRMLSSRITRLLWGRHVGRAPLQLVRSLFLRMLAVVYLCAFISLWTQMEGLIGAVGIQPAEETIARWAKIFDSRDVGFSRYLRTPTLFWVSAGEFARHLGGGVGVLASVLLLLGVAPRYTLLLLWLLYLSLLHIAEPFLSFQWDTLLLETGLLSIFIAPAGLWPRGGRTTAVPGLAVWLLRWLLFRLMFASGCVKLLSGDTAWRGLTALQYHYETQPLPTPMAWYAHHLPAALHWWSALAMFAVELAIPFLIFLPRRARLLACILFVGLELAIALTGNYTFFNLLTIALCVLLLDDEYLRRVLPPRWRARLPRPLEARPLSGLFRTMLGLLAVVVVFMTSVQMLAMFRPATRWWKPVVVVYQWVEPFRSINHYGLFAVMTTTRPEIIVEGSRDGQEWRPYEFKYKPGQVRERPRFVAPHQPRLDWQMWFAALGHYRHNPWFLAFVQRLLDGSPEVLGLLETNPFTNSPPKYIRAQLYEYEFTTPAESRRTGAWWKRELKGTYLPVVTLETGRLIRAETAERTPRTGE